MQKLAVFCSILFLIAACAYAQGGYASMAGTVNDPSGAVITDARVTMTQAGTEIKRTATTNASGQFTIPSIPPAVYKVTVEASGFKTYNQDVTLLADQSGSMNIAMQIGASGGSTYTPLKTLAVLLAKPYASSEPMKHP